MGCWFPERLSSFLSCQVIGVLLQFFATTLAVPIKKALLARVMRNYARARDATDSSMWQIWVWQICFHKTKSLRYLWIMEEGRVWHGVMFIFIWSRGSAFCCGNARVVVMIRVTKYFHWLFNVDHHVKNLNTNFLNVIQPKNTNRTKLKTAII